MRNIKAFTNGLKIKPVTSSAIDTEGEAEVFSNKLRMYLGGSVREIITADQTQTLTNKTISSPTFAGALTLPEIATPATPASGFGKIYFKSDGKLYQLDDGGSETQVGAPPTLAAFGSTANAEGASISASVITLQPASASFPGGVSTGTQSFAGNKTFTGTIAASNYSGTSSGTNTGDQTITLTGEATGSGTGSFAVTLTNSAVIGKVLTGYVAGAGTIAATDTILQAFNKLGATAAGAVSSLTGDVTGTGPGATATTIANNAVTTAKIINDAVTNEKLANMAASTFKGRITGSTGDPEDLTGTQATSLLNAFVGDSGSGGTKGLVLAPAAGDAAAGKFLKADGTWSTVGGGTGDVVGPASATNNAIARFDGTTGKLIQDSSLAILGDGGDLVLGNSSFDSGQLTINGYTNSREFSLQSALTVQTGYLSSSTFKSGVFSVSNPIAGGATSNLKGIDVLVSKDTSGGGAGTIHGAHITITNAASTSMGSTYGVRVQSNNSGTISNFYGIRTAAATGTVTTNNYALYVESGASFFGGNLQVATAGYIEFQDTTGGEYVRLGAPGTVSSSYTLTLPSAVASAGQVLTDVAGNGVLSWTTPAVGTGDVVGPASATDNAITRFDGTTGKLVQNSNATLGDTGKLILSVAHVSDASASYSARINTTSTTGSGGGDMFGLYNILTSTVSDPAGTIYGLRNSISITHGATNSDIAGIVSSVNATGTNTSATVYNTYIDNSATIGSVGNFYGLYISGAANGTVATNNYALYVATGNSLFGGNLQLTTAKYVEFQDTTGGQYVRVSAPGTVSGSYAITLPPAVASAGQVLTDVAGNGTLTWVTPVSPNLAITNKTANYTAVAGTDKVITCDASGGAFTITLPAASGNTGVTFMIKKTDSSVNTVSVSSSDTIDGLTSQSIATQYQAITVVSNGTVWWII